MKLALLGVAAAAVLFRWAFQARPDGFWGRLPMVAGGLGVLALAAKPELREERPNFSDVVTGVLSGLGLCGLFQLGDRFARQTMPNGAADAEHIDGLRQGAPTWLVAMLLAGVIAPCEELFWRGLVFDSFAKKLGHFRGGVTASLSYGAVHLATGNLTLSGAATLAGGYWGLQYGLQRRLPALIISHIVLDLWTFLFAPNRDWSALGERKP
jgi:membrane protease YdiL (CAAX protease family)